jgi:tripartite-type tricarboxylate transporter receptor subunit TctC
MPVPSHFTAGCFTLVSSIMVSRRRFLGSVAAAAGSAALPPRAFADPLPGNWPKERVIRAMQPFAAGSTSDVVARVVLEGMSQSIGQTIVVENRGGGGGSIGTAAVAKADPDGYTILTTSSGFSAAPAVYPNLPYDPATDFAGVAIFGAVPNVLMIAPEKGIRTAAEFVERAKAGTMTFASAGVGSATFWAAERFLISAGVKATHVPFSGGPEALTEVMTGRVDFCFIGTASALPLIKDGRLLALAVSSAKRSSALPEVPTTVELGFADSNYIFWNGILVPAKTPRPIVERLHAETQKALALPAVQAKLAVQGNEPLSVTPEEFDAMIAKEIVANIALAKAAGLKFG